MTPYFGAARVTLLLLFFAATATADVEAADPIGKADAKNTRIWVQLVNVTIPPDSTHRKRDDLDRPPQLMVQIEKSGELIAGQSTAKTGWSADFAATEENMWPIQLDPGVRYTVQLYDYNRFSSNVQILSITGLKGEDFLQPIREVGGQLDDKARLAEFTFKKVVPPKEKK